jgi:hypothetical protein
MANASSSLFEFAAVPVSSSTAAFRFVRTPALRHDAETALCIRQRLFLAGAPFLSSSKTSIVRGQAGGCHVELWSRSGVPLAPLAGSRTTIPRRNTHMKHNITTAVAALAVLAAGCNARSSAKVTVAGCVQSAEQGLASSSDSLVSSTASSSSASPSDQAASDRARADQAPPADASAPPAPPSDASAPAAPAATGSMYVLDGNKSELRDHLNQRVEITGRLDSDKSAKDSSSARQELHVDSVRPLAGNCNP